MKTTNLILATITAASTLGFSAFAGDLVPTQITNGHGQSVVLNKSSESTVALFARGNAAGKAAASTSGSKAVTLSNAHGQSVIVYRAE